MPLNNPFARKEPEVNPEVGNDKPPEKTTAELIAESIKPLSEQFTSTLTEFRTKLDAVAESVKRPEKKVENTPTEIPSVFEDENGAFGVRIAPIFARQLEIEARLAYSEVKQEYVDKGYGEVLNMFAADISRVLDGSPLVDGAGKPCRGDKTYIRNVINMVFGQKAMESNIKFGGKDRGFFVETAGGGIEATGSGPTNDGLTEGQRKIFARMGIPTEAAKKTMAKLKFSAN